jgi:predicted acyl esterase
MSDKGLDASKALNYSDSPPTQYDREPLYSGIIKERDVLVRVRDGVNLCVDVYRPDSPEKFPALLAFAVYNKDLQGPELAESMPPQPAWSHLWTGPMEAGDTRFFVSRGYAHVMPTNGRVSRGLYPPSENSCGGRRCRIRTIKCTRTSTTSLR